ncbi:MAG: AEC family transporter [Bacillota bacterium]|nr:AEC family transporter [Bacillota bacterium]
MYGQFFLLFALIIVGYYCNKKGWLNRETNKNMGSMVMHVMIPAMLVATISTLSVDDRVLVVFLLMAAAQIVVMILFGLLVRLYARFRKLDPRLHPMLDITVASVNTGFIGLPVTQIFFGNSGVLYMSAGVLSLNLYLWIYGVCVIENKKIGGGMDAVKTVKKVLLNPNCLSVFIGLAMALTHVTGALPQPIMGFLKKLGDLATPLSLIYIGALAGDSGISSLFKEKTALEFSVLKMILMPGLAAVVLLLLPEGMELVQSVFLLSMALPSAIVVPMMVEQYGYGEKMSSDIVLWTTFLSMLTMPVCVWLSGVLY